jgi:hypothetical protein
LADIALTIIRERYSDSGPTLAYEKLREHHEIALAKETVRKLMTKVGLWIPRKQRRHRFTSRAIVGTDSENWCKSTAANTPGSRIAHLRARAGVSCSFCGRSGMQCQAPDTPQCARYGQLLRVAWPMRRAYP